MNINIAKIEGSLTTMVNRHLRIAERAAKSGVIHKAFVEELEDLLEIVIDMQGEADSNEDVELLKKRIRELEESCENDSEVIRNLHKQIKEIKDRFVVNESNEQTCVDFQNGYDLYTKEKMKKMEEI